MAHSINTELCLACGSCEGSCPVGAISLVNNQYFEIDPELCVDCGACEPGCPGGAIQS